MKYVRRDRAVHDISVPEFHKPETARAAMADIGAPDEEAEFLDKMDNPRKASASGCVEGRRAHSCSEDRSLISLIDPQVSSQGNIVGGDVTAMNEELANSVNAEQMHTVLRIVCGVVLRRGLRRPDSGAW